MFGANELLDNTLRGATISAIIRVATGRPVFVMATVNDGVRFAGASIVYDIVKQPLNQVLPPPFKLPNGN